MTGCTRHETTVGYALHALEPDEEQEVLEHLPTCPPCRELLRETTAVTSMFALAVADAEPPAGMRDRLLAAATADDAVTGGRVLDRTVRPDTESTTGPRRSTSSRPGTGRPDAGRPGPGRPGAGRPAAAPGRGRGRRRWVPVLVAAAVLGIVLASVRVLMPSTENPSTSIAQQQAQQIVREVEARDPASTEATMRTADGTAIGVVVADMSSTRLVPIGLAPASPGQNYVLWRVAGPSPVAVGVVAADGTTVAVPSVPPTTDRPTTAFAVSVEPEGTVPTRPSTVIADGAVV